MAYSQLRCRVTGKVGWRTAQAAKIRLSEIQRNPLSPVVPARIYSQPCQHCGLYHMTSQPLYEETR